MTLDDRREWVELDPTTAGLDERLELVLAIVRKTVLGEGLTAAEKAVVIDAIAPVVAQHALVGLDAWLAGGLAPVSPRPGFDMAAAGMVGALQELQEYLDGPA